MKILLAVLMLLVNFMKSVLLSGLDTARIILSDREGKQGGLTRVSYGTLGENTASLLGALITLTPGTTLVEINTEAGELILHMLDLDAREETLKTIQHDFCEHLHTIDGVLR